ncbi:hypothetical protein FRB90_008134 [Tulasnella sp. 427]|nr:hypothetical protein FRB90_008134 [Tulasnella sp. 427]
MDMKWFQMGGYGAQTNHWDYPVEVAQLFKYNNNIPKTLFPPPVEQDGYTQSHPPLSAIQSGWNSDQAELTLGIRPDGTSALLITSQQCLMIFEELCLSKDPLLRDRDRGRIFPSSTFRSLSPILFTSTEDLRKKMVTLRPSTNSKQRDRYHGMDTSQANKAFATETNVERKKVAGLRRSGFELSRVLYLKLYNRLSPTQSLVYSNGWEGGIAGLSTLMFNLWSPNRTSPDDPVLDIAWSKVNLQQREDGTVVENHSITHFRIDSFQSLKRKGDTWTEGKPKDLPEEKGGTMVVSAEECQRKVHEHFAKILSEQAIDPTKPHILLVYDAQLTLQVLKGLGIETERMVVGLHDLLDPSLNPGTHSHKDRERSYPSSSRDSPSYSSSSRASPSWSSGSRNGRHRDHRERSPPPRRSGDYHYYQGRSSRFKDEPYEPRLYRTDSPTPGPSVKPDTPVQPRRAPIYIIDVRELYGTVSQRDVYLHESRSLEISLREVCIRVGIQEVQEGWSAGLDAEYLYDVWQELAGGSAIDERRTQLVQNNAMPTTESSPDDSDEAAGLHGGPSGTAPDPYASLYDDDD